VQCEWQTPPIVACQPVVTSLRVRCAPRNHRVLGREHQVRERGAARRATAHSRLPCGSGGGEGPAVVVSRVERARAQP